MRIRKKLGAIKIPSVTIKTLGVTFFTFSPKRMVLAGPAEEILLSSKNVLLPFVCEWSKSMKNVSIINDYRINFED